MTRVVVFPIVLVAGAAALGWEVLWTLHAALALGHGATGAALTLAATMGGMALGALGMGAVLRRWERVRPGLVYGLVEIGIGLWGLGMLQLFEVVARLDAWAYGHAPGAAPLVGLLGLALVIGPPAALMGASVPLFGRLAAAHGVDLSVLYGLNVLGAGVGAMGIAFALLPTLGVARSLQVVAALDIVVGLLAIAALREKGAVAGVPAGRTESSPTLSPDQARVFVLVSGFATFALEVSWFRSLRAAFNSTTEGFALMLSSVLVALAIGAEISAPLRRRGVPLGKLLGAAGLLILLITPVIERYPLIVPQEGPYYGLLVPLWFLQCLAICGPAMIFLGTALPWALDEANGVRAWASLYALNTLGAVTGSLVGAWVLLPTIGFAATSWLVGGIVATTGFVTVATRKTWLPATAAVLVIAVLCRASVAERLTLGFLRDTEGTVVAHAETPDTTLAVVELPGQRMLVIDGFVAAGEANQAHYMTWMGRLPMIVHPDPETALVICFGTGQTAHAVRHEGASTVDIVDVNPGVFALAKHFPSNRAVLEDPKAHAIAMDGRAWLRRTDRLYDVITLEPMAPFQAGVNALYSRDFYELARTRMTDDGVIAQWMPFHLMPPRSAHAIARAFLDVFPNAMMWIDPVDNTGILIGSMATEPIGDRWPGLTRAIERDLSPEAILAAVRVETDDLRLYAQSAGPVTDDNQALAYGRLSAALVGAAAKTENLQEIKELLERAR